MSTFGMSNSRCQVKVFNGNYAGAEYVRNLNEFLEHPNIVVLDIRTAASDYHHWVTVIYTTKGGNK